MEQPLRILIIDDSEDDALLLVRVLGKNGYDPVHERVDTAEDMLSALSEKPWDVILCDFKMPCLDAFHALDLFKKSGVDIPFLIVSGTIGEDTAVEIMRAGAHDYIMKDRLQRLLPVIQRELKEAEERRENRRKDQALKEKERQILTITENTPDVIARFDKAFRYVFVNPAIEKMTGLHPDIILGKTNEELGMPEENVNRWNTYLRKTFDTAATVNFEFELESKEGKRLLFSSLVPEFGEGGEVVSILSLTRDITERKIAEESLRASEERFSAIFHASPTPIAITRLRDNLLTDVNEAFVQVTGFTREETIGRAPTEIGSWAEPRDRERLVDTLRDQRIVQDFEFQVRHKSGHLIDMILSAELIELSGEQYMLSLALDITDRKRIEEMLRTRMRLMEFAVAHSVGELLQNALDEIGKFTDSPIGFYHFVEPDQKTLSLQAWSTRTRGEFCTAAGKGSHYSIDDAGVWVDCVHEKHPVIHNDYESLPHRKGMPEGHAKVIRELVVPIMRNDRIVAILGIGNKPSDYDEKDIELVSYLADVTWEIAMRKQLEVDQQESIQRERRGLAATVQAISMAVELRDPYTSGHQRRVADLARAIATEMGLSHQQIDGLRIASVIHDIGKLSVPAEILSKPSKLTSVEYLILQQHPQAGYDILKDIDFPWPIAKMILQHHERMDGSGYPNGLKGNDILLEARILCVADVVEAISSHRPYRPSRGIEHAMEEISQHKGILYDPEVVDACVRLFHEKEYNLSI